MYFREYDGEAIVRKLEETCQSMGNGYLQKVSYQNENNIMICCPFHANGHERKPSCGVRKDINVAHCFACGWKGKIEDIIAECLGIDANDAVHWIASNFGAMDMQARSTQARAERARDASENTFLPLTRATTQAQQQPAGFTQEELRQYKHYHPYLEKRGIKKDTAKYLNIGYDISTDSITFPVYTLDARPCFIARRSVKEKRFDVPKAARKPLYLGEMIEYRCDEVWVCEGLFDAVTCWQNKTPAVALMGTGSADQIEDLKRLQAKSYVLALDNDKAGYAGAKKLYKSLKDVGVIKKAVFPYKDINECVNCFDAVQVCFY